MPTPTKPNNESTIKKPLVNERQLRLARKFDLEKNITGKGPNVKRHVLDQLDEFFQKHTDLDLANINNEPNNPYREFLQLLKKGVFNDGGENAIAFLKALKGGPQEKLHAKKLLQEMTDGRRLGAADEKKEIKRLHELATLDSAEGKSAEISSTVAAFGTTAELHGKFEKIEALQKENTRFYTPEKLPENRAQELKQYTKLWETNNRIGTLQKELQGLESGRRNETMEVRRAVIENELTRLYVLRDELASEITGVPQDQELDIANTLLKHIREFMAEVEPIMEREVKRMEALRWFSEKAGIPDINQKPLIFKVNLPNKDGQGTQEKEVEVKEIIFRDDDPEMPKNIGELTVRYALKDDSGSHEEEANYLNFLRVYIYRADGVLKTASDKQAQKKFKPESGQKFSRKNYVESEDGGKPKKVTENFKVRNVGDDGRVTLDREVEFSPKGWLNRGKIKMKRKFTAEEFERLIITGDWTIPGRNLPQELIFAPAAPATTAEPQLAGRDELMGEYERLSAQMPLAPDVERQWQKIQLDQKAAFEMGNKNQTGALGPGATMPGGTMTGSPDDFPEGLEGVLGASGMGSGGRPAMPSVEEMEANAKREIARPPEALPYKDVFNVGQMDRPESNWAADLWSSTRFLSVDDVWAMGKAMWEYYKRRWERRQKDRYSSIGKDIPWFAPEMKRINQAAENEEVNQFKESFDQKGIFEIEDRLRNTRNRDELKACFIVLSDKGQLRWDDVEMWKNLNNFVSADLSIPIPADGDPYRILSNDPLSPDYQKTGFTYLQAAIDSLWGEGGYNDWFAGNKSKYESNAKSYYTEGKQLEGVQGGHERRLGELLMQHKNGVYVNPHEYEGLILHSIEAGKSSLQTKLYYMIEGVAFKNADGRTILGFDRMAHINSEMLARFPVLEYLCAQVPREDGGKGTKARFTLKDYEQWVSMFDEGVPDNYRPTEAVDRFMWEYALPSDDTQNRINKDLRNADNLDHDDMFAYLPPASSQVLDNACRTVGGGGKHLLTIEGYANAAPGFSQYMKSLAQFGKNKKLIRAFQSYVRYNAIMLNKWKKDAGDYMRMDKETLTTSTICSDEPPILFMTEIDNALTAAASAYNSPQLSRIVSLIQTDTSNLNMYNRDDKTRQQEIEYALQQFDRVFEDTVTSQDGGEKLKNIVLQANFRGMKFSNRDVIKARKEAKGIT